MTSLFSSLFSLIFLHRSNILTLHWGSSRNTKLALGPGVDQICTENRLPNRSSKGILIEASHQRLERAGGRQGRAALSCRPSGAWPLCHWAFSCCQAYPFVNWWHLPLATTYFLTTVRTELIACVSAPSTLIHLQFLSSMVLIAAWSKDSLNPAHHLFVVMQPWTSYFNLTAFPHLELRMVHTPGELVWILKKKLASSS